MDKIWGNFKWNDTDLSWVPQCFEIVTKVLEPHRLIELKHTFSDIHCVKSVQIRSDFNPNTGKYGTEITPYLDTFQAAIISENIKKMLIFLIDQNWFNSADANVFWLIYNPQEMG